MSSIPVEWYPVVLDDDDNELLLDDDDEAQLLRLEPLIKNGARVHPLSPPDLPRNGHCNGPAIIINVGHSHRLVAPHATSTPSPFCRIGNKMAVP